MGWWGQAKKRSEEGKGRAMRRGRETGREEIFPLPFSS